MFAGGGLSDWPATPVRIKVRVRIRVRVMVRVGVQTGLQRCGRAGIEIGLYNHGQGEGCAVQAKS